MEKRVAVGRFLIFFLVIITKSVAITVPPDALSTAVKSINDFSLDLYLNEVELKGDGHNILLSPLSASLATAILHAGACGKTWEEISNCLHYPNDQYALEHGFTSLLEHLAHIPKVILNTASQVYVENAVHAKLNKNFIKTLTKVHKSNIQPADFRNHPDLERISINKWVSNQTENKINELLSPGIITSSTAMLLINTIYFHGKWGKKFRKQRTKTTDFYISKSEKIDVSMMNQINMFNYANITELDAQAIELPYTDENVSLQVILPNAKDGLKSLQQKLSTSVFDINNINFTATILRLRLPKFKLKETVNMKVLYEQMGMTSMFGEKADFCKMFDGNVAFVSDAIQKTFMEVKEDGVTAGAATGMVVADRSSLPEKTFMFEVNHPFMIRLVIKNFGNAPLTVFIGSIYNPEI